jgi:hypothetical protein
VCSDSCQSDADCPAKFFCSEAFLCMPRCDDGGAGCQAPDLACDTGNLAGGNGFGASGFAPGAIWCYQCVTGDDCGASQVCDGVTCGLSCYGDPSCHAGQLCGVADSLCHSSCDAGTCPSGQICDLGNQVGNGSDLCYQCLSVEDCPVGEGCNSVTHSCGTCVGPNSRGGPIDCPPDAICSNYWPPSSAAYFGVCLQNCDVFDCLNPTDICAVLPSLTPDHRYCFGCLRDSDCGDAGAICDTSVGLTFTCKPPAL